MSSQTHRSLEIVITGFVQGVGFRPFVYRLAHEENLGGWIRNNTEGVVLVVEGNAHALMRFRYRLQRELPPLARIDSFRITEIPAQGLRAFHIIDSETDKNKKASVLPDISLCDACLAEMQDPKNRRYRYPFITCTDCGPRYSILRTVPYDRPNTSMAEFSMCDACRQEYEDPSNRRYHAQPIGCWECGPMLHFWYRAQERWLELSYDDDIKASSERFLEETARRIETGQIVAIKGLGGFHLICDALNEKAVQRLRERKRRPSKPFALMVPSLQTAELLAALNEKERELLVSKERPIVLLRRKDATNLPDSVAPGIDRLGVMLPYTPLHHLLLQRLNRPIVATSANLSDEPIIYEGETLRRKLGYVVDAVLDHDRDIVNACDDSVAQVVGDLVQWLRVARGIAPLSLPFETKSAASILAVGANQKNTIAFSLDNKVVVSPHIGDLNSIESMEYFHRTVETFQRFYDFVPETVVCDLHAGYETTKWTKAFKIEHPKSNIHQVQHHYAHVLAVMAEHNYRDKVLAFAFDGTGYGMDGTIWGGEVFIADVESSQRIAHLRPFRLLGGEKAVKEPRRVALALLFELFDLDEILAMDNPTVKAFLPAEIRLLHQSWQKALNAPLTTSMGRLFDAVASLTGVCQIQSYEGESGLRLEAWGCDHEDTDASLLAVDGKQINWQPLIHALAVGEANAGRAFIAALVHAIARFTARYSDLPVVLAGGVFQNRTLMQACLKSSFADRLMLSRLLPPNDAAVALGQLHYALHSDAKLRNTSSR
ncbi:carbamoyltransferase HypF [Nitratifractor sp.]|uniref:carbamoyltransferase HypF n=1 Tax=Nitratifractor sp. TaxID=2268144 RepID=UPI0025D289D3|nr:carbamoyltransferase HypF [Nitratifractor sp.]